MFYLYQSNRLESLAALFARIQKVKPLKCALQPEQIVVQSQGMRRYLNTCLARDLGVAANLAFSLPAAISDVEVDEKTDSRYSGTQPVCTRSHALAAAGFVPQRRISKRSGI